MPDITQGLRVFLCHASGDKPAVRDLYFWLRAYGISPWLDEEDLVPGKVWASEIPKAVRTADVVLVCLSRKSVTKTGYVQKEIKYALDVADEQPEGTIYIVPTRLEEWEVPERLSHLQWVDLFRNGGYAALMRALQERANDLRLAGVRSPVVPELRFKEEWNHKHPVDHEGLVWIRVVAKPENRGKRHEYVLRWGPWEYRGDYSFADLPYLTLVHSKRERGTSVPLTFRISPASSVIFGHGEPPDKATTEMHNGWLKDS